MEKLRLFLENPSILSEFRAFLGQSRLCYLVGGAVRDAWLGRPIHDFDFTTPEDPTPLAKAWARHCGGHWFWLDEARCQSRVVLGRGTQAPTFDFAPFRAADLAGDLRGRDFTLNALALALGGSAPPELIDPLGGGADLAAGKLRACAPNSFHDDPLRVLRAARFAAVLGVRPDEQTLGWAQRAVPRLTEIAGERIKAELFALFGAADIPAGLEVMVACGALEALAIGGIPGGVQAAMTECLEFDRRLEIVSETLSECRSILESRVEAGLTRVALLRLGIFLRWCPPVVPFKDFARRLALARGTTQRLQALLDLDVRAVPEPPGGFSTPRQLARWVSLLGRDPRDALLFLAGLDCDARIKEQIPRSLSVWQALNAHGRLPPLVDGTWMRQELELKDGRHLGRLLEILAEAELKGMVSTPENARKFLKSLHQKED